MKSLRLTLFFCLLSLLQLGQTTKEDALRRFNYLNFHNSLNSLVQIDDAGVKIFASAANKKANKPEFTLYWEEVTYFREMLKVLPLDTVAKIYAEKKNLSKVKDWKNIFEPDEKPVGSTPLKKLSGMRIAIDPGHMAGDFETGKIEQKFLEFRANDTTGLKEEVKIVEGILTWQTAMLLKNDLEKEGAIVFVTRKEINFTSFGMSYNDWLIKRKGFVLDSLLKAERISAAEHKKYKNATAEKLFWDFFRDHDLANRMRQINAFRPDLSVIIHYNVDEKNTDWLKPTHKNFTMCFIGGGMTADNFKRTIHKVNFLRLLLTDHLDKSEKISGLTVKEFTQQLNVPIAKKSDALYLAENCNSSATPGVYCRNLALCRGIGSPLVYGECLYQDNFAECSNLSKQDKIYAGIKTNERVKQVAECYLNAIRKYFSEK